MQSQTTVFSKLVRSFMGRAPLVVAAGTPCAEVIAGMTTGDATSAVITDRAGCPVGIVTEQDITRRAAFQVEADTPVEAIMTAPVITIEEAEYLYHAIALMRRRGWRHMPVVDSAGRLCGLLDLPAAMADAYARLMGQIDALTREDTVDGLRQIKAAQVSLAEQLFDDDLPASEIQALLTHINNDLYRQLVERALEAMRAEGLGPPPVEFCVIVMGSGGRGENYLMPDQDNGIILADYPDDRHTEIDAWFITLAERLCGDLDTVGIPYCKGHVMATNPLWRKTLSQWQEQVGLWSRRRGTTVLRLSDIFFDFRPVWGDISLAAALRRHVTAVARGNPAFLRQMYEDDIGHNVALGLFNQFITEKDLADHKGEINLKHTGTLPLVEAVRLLALREGIEPTSTLARLGALLDGEILDRDEHDYLIGAFHHVCRLLLRQQIADLTAGRAVSNYVDPESLTEREKDLLVDSLKAIRTLRGRMKAEFTADIF